MINILISLSLALFSFEMFSLSSKISNLNKTMLNIPLSIFSFSVPVGDQSELHFDKTVLEGKLDEYFNKNVTKLVNNFETKYTYYSSKTQSICMSDNCDTIHVALDANIDSLYQYHRIMYYTLGGGNNGQK